MYITCRIKWVNDNTEFEGVIKTLNEIDENDEDIFFYGLSKEEIEGHVKNKDVVENEWQILEIISVDDSI